MPKMKDRNAQLKNSLGAIAPKERLVAVSNIPTEDTVNRQGYKAYKLDDKLRLISMLNTLKLQPQFYRTENETMKELRGLIERIGMKEPLFVAKAIVYSRCAGEGMRSINHLAAALAAPFASGQEWAKRFYGLYDKKASKNGVVKGGTIFRVDDMTEIKDAYEALTGKALSNAMKKAFAEVLENLDTYQLAKYKKTVIDIANLVHPNSSKSTATITVDGKPIKTLDALMKGITVSADTWETQNSEAGQEVAKAVKEGKISKDEAKVILAEAKADNWESLLKDGKLPVLAALRNIRNILNTPRKEMIAEWCKLITDSEKIRKALILPIHFDLAYQVVNDEFNGNQYAAKVIDALQEGYEAAIPNIAAAFPGKTCVIYDCSCSMGGQKISTGNFPVSRYYGYDRSYNNTSCCAYKASLVAATFAKATGADVVKFGSSASWVSYNKNLNVFKLAELMFDATEGSTCPGAAFELIRRARKAYDRIIFISDNEMNSALDPMCHRYNGCSDEYKKYVHDVCDPYIYCIDLASYGTTPLKNEAKVQYYFGYGPSMYEDVVKNEFNPMSHIEKIEKVII